jgi:FkbM family methyltransferase
MLIPLQELYDRYHINPTGVLHIGASTGQEADAYHAKGLKVVWVEAIRDVYKQLCRNVTKYTGTICLNACVSDKDGEIVPFNISNNEMQSSSMFEFGTHTQEHPGVVFTERTRLHTATVRTLLKDRELDQYEYDFINIDIQGAELLALKGMDLLFVNYAYLEVNERHLYKGCPLLHEIDEYLLEYGLERVELKMTNHGWGDAFYIRKTRSANNMVSVPDHFQPKHPFAYPGDNDVEFERWYFERYKTIEGRTYLPIMWTAYYCKADREPSRKEGLIKSLQRFIDSLPPLKYYTIVQYDDGILNDLSHIDIKVFSMSGGRIDYALPLICKAHQPITINKDLYASFIGRNTHPIRTQLLKLKQPGWMITNAVQKLPAFCNVLARSTFTLCPRGYGPTSFRICEALQYGSIPVYISDKFIEPHGIDFNEYGVKVTPNQINDLPLILAGVDVTTKRDAAINAYRSYYTYEVNKEIIDYQCSL